MKNEFEMTLQDGSLDQITEIKGQYIQMRLCH